MESETKSSQMPLASAAMVELKAELSRKKEEFRREKTSNVNVIKGKKTHRVSLKKKTDVWNQKNAGVSARMQKDIEQNDSDEDENALLKSKLILERKCKIYERISSSGDIPEEDGSEGYLVDFQKKAVDALVEQREMKRREVVEEEEEEVEREALAEPIPEAENSDEEWVDYTDSLGRSRRCLRKDLKDLQKKDQDLTISKSQAKSRQRGTLHGKDTVGTDSQQLMSDDMFREKMRQKWENEAKQLVEKGQQEIHYANVQFDEIRTHGVGFYQFSKDQEEREAQLEKLNKLRDETKTERSRTETIKDKRKAMMEARLAKVRERRKLKAKEMPSTADDDTESSKVNEVDVEEKKKAEEMKKVKEEAERAAEEARKKFIREWDKKKVPNSWKGDGYVESRRQERESEFAPPSMYFNDANPSPRTSSNKPDLWNQSKSFPQSYPASNENKKCEDGKGFYESCSDPQVSESSDARSAMQPSKVPATSLYPAHSVDAVPIHSIPLPRDIQSISENSDISSNIPNSQSHHIYNKAVQYPGDNSYSYCRPQHHHNSAEHMQGHGLSSNAVTTKCTSITQQQVSWSQYQSSEPQQSNVFWSQQWPQHQYYPHKVIQPQMAEHVANANPDQAATDISHCSPTFHSDAIGVKRPSALGMDTETSTSNVPKKPKVPKSAILDNRFMLNSEASQPSGMNASTTETCFLSTVQAVPYKPGSFTDAKFKHELSQYDEESIPSTRGKASISGGPMLYTKEQRQQQKLKIEEDEGSEVVNDKVEEFLKSVRNEMI